MTPLRPRLQALGKLPRWQVFALVVGLSIVLSQVATWVTLISFGADETTRFIGALTAVVVPLIAASACTFVLLSLVDEIRSAHARAEQLASTDALTDTLNRRRFTEVAESALASDGVAGRPTSLLLLDVDDFKAINDRHGHAAGDLSLKLLAGVCRRFLRERDLIARWGGEEFVVLLPGTSEDAARAFANRLKEAVAAERLVEGGLGLSLTVSVGVATRAPVQVPSLDLLVARADAAMYAAKATGKNRVIVAEPLALID